MGANHHHPFDPLAGIDSPVHRAPAWLKLGVAVGVVLLLVLSPLTARTASTVFPGVLLLLVAVCGAGFVPPAMVVQRVLVLEPVVLFAAGLALLKPNGTLVFTAIAIRSTLCIATMVVLSATTSFHESLAVLRRWGLPAVMITTLALTFRYLFVLTDESQRLRRARAARTISPPQGLGGRLLARLMGRNTDWGTLGSTTATLLTRTTDRADRIYQAMTARGWK